MSCCISGSVTSATPTGSEISLGGAPCYLSTPPGSNPPPSSSILLLPDVFGFASPNARVIADTLAARCGVCVYIPELMAGDSLPHTLEPALIGPGAGAGVLARLSSGLSFVSSLPTFISWMARHGDSVTLPRMSSFLAALRAERGVTRLCVTGYCWGGRHAILLGAAAMPAGLKVCGLVPVHPSSVSATEMAAAQGVPARYILAGKDAIAPSAAVVAAAAPSATARTWAGMAHGFAIRGNEGDAAVSAARAEAIQDAAEFIVKVLSE